MKQGLTIVGWLAAGMGLMYLVDVLTGKRVPGRGRSMFLRSAKERWPGRWGRGLRDQRLARHVRSEIDEVLEHPHALVAEVRSGHVWLRGGLCEDEVATLVERISQLPGVTGVTSEIVALPAMEEEIG